MKLRAIFFALVFFGAGCENLKSWIVGKISFDDDKNLTSAPKIETKPNSNQRKSLPIRLVQITQSLSKPTEIKPIPDQKNQLIVLQKDGEAVILNVNSGKHLPLFKISVDTRSEMGLLGIAFHPKFETNRTLYVHYNPLEKQITKIAEWKWQSGKSPKEIRTIYTTKQPYPNHNGGQISFGNDDYLYVALGDGGWRDDPDGNGQNKQVHLGSILRLNVNPEFKKPYKIPKNNPFIGTKGAEEVFIWGMRNPWKFDFSEDGQLVIADVGQNKFEEVSILGRGDNGGWNVKEGFDCFTTKEKCQSLNAVDPIWQYPREDGISITGGYIVKDPRLKKLNGYYLNADFGTGNIWAIPLGPKGEQIKESDVYFLGSPGLNISTFGKDSKERLYIGAYGRGAIYRIEPL